MPGRRWLHGLQQVRDVVASHPPGTFHGYCFYHGQDLGRAVTTGHLFLAYGDVEATTDGSIAIGKIVTQAFRGEGLVCEWNADFEKRILVMDIDWKRRRQPA